MIFRAISHFPFAVFKWKSTLWSEKKMKAPRSNLLPVYKELKVKLTSFKPIDDNTSENTLKKFDCITLTIIYMIYAIQLFTGSWTETNNEIYYTWRRAGNARVLRNINEFKPVTQSERNIFPWKGTRKISPKRKVIFAFSLSVARARQCCDHKIKFDV